MISFTFLKDDSQLEDRGNRSTLTVHILNSIYECFINIIISFVLHFVSLYYDN